MSLLDNSEKICWCIKKRNIEHENLNKEKVENKQQKVENKEKVENKQVKVENKQHGDIDIFKFFKIYFKF